MLEVDAGHPERSEPPQPQGESDEVSLGYMSVAAPVFGHRGMLLGARSITLPGCRANVPRVTGPMWDFHAAKTIALMHALGIERADFICNSWGGTIALCLARMTPRGHVYVMDRAGHHLQEERPGDYYQRVSGFLRQEHGA